MKIDFYRSVEIEEKDFLKTVKRNLTVDSKSDFYFDDYYIEIWHDVAHNGDLPYILSISDFSDVKPPIYDMYAELEDIADFLNKKFNIQLK